MTVEHQQGSESLADEDLQAASVAEGQGTPNEANSHAEGADQGQGNAEGEGARGTRPRPGKLERRLQRTERELEEERRVRAAEREHIRQLEARLAEATEAGSRMAQHSLAAQIAQAEAEYRDALTANDTDAIVKAQRKLGGLAASEVALRNAPRPPMPQRPAVPEAPRYTATTQAWVDANPWFGRDPGKTRLAQSIHETVVGSGIPLDSDEYWRRMEAGVNAAIPGTMQRPRVEAEDDGEDEGDGAPAPRQAAAPRPAAPAGNRAPPRAPQSPRAGVTVRLTPEEADAARACGMTPQEYSAAKAQLRAAGRLGAR